MKIDPNQCVGCANCVPVCPMGAIYIAEDNLARINEEACVECYTCYRGLSVENLPPKPVLFIRKVLASLGLRYQPEPDICPTGALVPVELEWPRIIRRAFSDPVVPHEVTGIVGRGTAEVKTNDVTGRIREGEVGFVIEFGRPGVGVYFRDVDTVARALASKDVVFERENPVTHLMTDPLQGQIREDLLDEKVLSCILEAKIDITQVTEILQLIMAITPSLKTVVSLGVSTRCDVNGGDPLKDILVKQGFTPWRAKVNVGMGRATNSEFILKEAIS
jgi:ferredoxin